MTLEAIMREVRNLPVEQRKKLAMFIVETLTEPEETHSLLELEGLGEDLWRGIDAQEYVNQLRSEWDHRP